MGEAVCFTDDKLRVNLPAADLNGVCTIKQLVEMLAEPPGDARRRITAETSRRVDGALKKLGIAPIRRQHEVGSISWTRRRSTLDPPGPTTWAVTPSCMI
ncbi:hypothetical protein ACFQ60_03385 [Streptomyces zhihengii]